MKERAPRNRTLTCSDAELAELSSGVVGLSAPANPEMVAGRIIHQSFHEARHFLPTAFADLVNSRSAI